MKSLSGISGLEAIMSDCLQTLLWLATRDCPYQRMTAGR